MPGLLRCAVIDCRPLGKTDYDLILSELSESRRRYVESFRLYPDRMMVAVAGLYMEHLARSFNTCVTKNENGKPIFGRNDIHLSVSHSSGFVAVSWSDMPIGVDIQAVVPMGSIAKRILTPKEVTEIYDRSDKNLTVIWTRKESYVKMTGVGMSRGFDTFDDSVLEPGYAFHSYEIEDGVILSICGFDIVPEIIRIFNPKEL